MSPTKKTGTVHRKTHQQPGRQTNKDVGPDTQSPEKPDFDKKDLGITPKRKAPGPGKKRRRPQSSGPVTDKASPNPEAKIKTDDDHST